MKVRQKFLPLWPPSILTCFVTIVIMILLPALVFRVYLNYADRSLQIDSYGRLIVNEAEGTVDFRQLNFRGYVCVALPELDDTNGFYIYHFENGENIPPLLKAVRSHARNMVSKAFDDIARNNFFFLLIDETGNYREYSRSLATRQNEKSLNQDMMFRKEGMYPNTKKCAPLEQALATCESWWGNAHLARECFFAFGRI
jgi:hypothetical protein